MPDKDIKMWRQMESPPSYAERLRAVKVMTKLIGFTRGDEFISADRAARWCIATLTGDD
jgi:hypothetical protein